MNGDGLLKSNSKRTVLILFITLFFVGYIFEPSVTKADEVSDLKDERTGLEDYLSDFNSQMEGLNSEISVLENQIAEVEQKIQTNNEILEQTKAEEAEQYEAMKTRIKFLYELGETSYIDILFSSDNISDMINKSEYVSGMIEYDRKMLKKYQETKQSIEDSEVELEQEKDELLILKEEAATRQGSLLSIINETQSKIAEYSEEIDALEEQARIEAEALRQQQEAANAGNEVSSGGQIVNDYVVQAGDLELLAAIIYCEARGESYYGQLAVGAVVLNRVNDPRFPNTIRGVIYSPNQFSPVWAGNPTYFDIALARGANASCIAAATEVLNGNIVGPWLYFRTVNGHEGTFIGNHVFY